MGNLDHDPLQDALSLQQHSQLLRFCTSSPAGQAAAAPNPCGQSVGLGSSRPMPGPCCLDMTTCCAFTTLLCYELPMLISAFPLSITFRTGQPQGFVIPDSAWFPLPRVGIQSLRPSSHQQLQHSRCLWEGPLWSVVGRTWTGHQHGVALVCSPCWSARRRSRLLHLHGEMCRRF